MPNMQIGVTAATSAARAELAATRREVDRFGTSTTAAGNNAERSRGKVARFGGAMGAAGKAFAPIAIAAAGAAVLKFGADSLQAASRTEQAFGAVDSVFGRNAAVVRKWANQAVNDVGLARSEYAEMAAVLGASLKNSGVENYTAKTRMLIRMGADLAAQFGGPTSQAVEALSSLLRGEADPIERYGISIKQSDVNARLAAAGLNHLSGKARKTAEMQVRLKLATEQSKDATGAFRREANTTAGQSQRLKARFENLKDTIGKKLNPALNGALRWMNRVGDAATRTGGKSGKMAQGFRQAGGDARGLSRSSDALQRALGRVGNKAGGTVQGQIDSLAYLFGVGAANATRFANALARVYDWLGNVGSRYIKNPVGGLFRTGAPTGLERARGVSSSSSRLSRAQTPRVSLTSAPNVTIAVDSPAMAKLFRVIVQDELRQRAGSATI